MSNNEDNLEALRRLAGQTSPASPDPSVTAKTAPRPSVTADLKGETKNTFNNTASKRPGRKKSRSPKLKSMLVGLALVGASAAVYFDQFADQYEQAQIEDTMMTVKAAGQKLAFLDPAGAWNALGNHEIQVDLDTHRELGQTVSDDYMIYIESRLQQAKGNVGDTAGYKGIDMSTSSGQDAFYQKALSQLPHFKNPLIAHLQAVTDHSADTTALDLVSKGGLEKLHAITMDASERMTIEAAVFFSLKKGGHDAQAQQVYETIAKNYAPSAALVEEETAPIVYVAKAVAEDMYQYGIEVYDRGYITSKFQADQQYEAREVGHFTIFKELATAFDLPDTELYILPHDKANALLGTKMTGNETAVSINDPLKTGDETVVLNYTDLSIDETFKEKITPKFMKGKYEQRDYQANFALASGVIAEHLYQVRTGDLIEKVITGNISTNNPSYSFAVMATVEKTLNTVDGTAPTITNKAAQDFGTKFQDRYTMEQNLIMQHRVSQSAEHTKGIKLTEQNRDRMYDLYKDRRFTKGKGIH